MFRSHTQRCHAALLACCTPALSPAALAAAAPLAADPLGGWQIAKVTAGLLVVVAAIIATAAGLKRLKSLHAAHGSHLKIIDGISVSTRDRIVLLEVDEQRLLVGISPGRIQPLHVFERPNDTTKFSELVEQASVSAPAVAEGGR